VTIDAVAAVPPAQKLRRRLPAKTKVGLVLLVLFVILAIVGPYVAPDDPSAVSADLLSPPSHAHLLGTTQSGQDVLSQVLVGARTTLWVALAAGALATAIAIVIGLTSGYLGGVADEALSAFANIFLVIPALPLVIILGAYLRGGGELAIVLVIGLTSWAFGARVLRALTLSMRRRDFVLAAQASGERLWRMVLFEIMPNELALVATAFILTSLFAVLTQAALAFLGVGDITTWSWGTTLYWAQASEAFTIGAWWWYVPPGLMIALFGMALTLINFGVDELINPRLRTASHDRAQSAPTPRAPVDEPSSAVTDECALEIRNLSVRYGSGPMAVRAVEKLDLALRRGEVLGIAGESGSGKSTLVHAVARLLRPPAVIASGGIVYHPAPGKDSVGPVNVLDLEGEALQRFRWREISIVFQSAMNALNPLLRVGAQLEDVLKAHRPEMDAAARRARAIELLELTRVSRDRIASYPHELSGGMRQRVILAMALALNPEIVILDEPTTALDVVVQREILTEVTALRQRLGFSIIFITHDLSLLLEIADRIAVMYAGRLVETAPATAVAGRPAHPYTAGLVDSFPPLHGTRRMLAGIPGSPPDLRVPPSGCAFHPRCPHAFGVCRELLPPLAPGVFETPAQDVACWLHDPGRWSAPMPDLSSAFADAGEGAAAKEVAGGN
jgi:peptide/nickel transport system permease protein